MFHHKNPLYGNCRDPRIYKGGAESLAEQSYKSLSLTLNKFDSFRNLEEYEKVLVAGSGSYPS